MNNYNENRNFGDKYLNAAKQVLNQVYTAEINVSIASDKLDTNEASDLIIHGAKSRILNHGDRVAVRARRHGYSDRYPNDFTIRSRAMFGGKTEYDKIMEGMGDFLIYGHAKQLSDEFERWLLIDLAGFRYAMETSKIPKQLKANHDGTRFYAFNIYNFPPNLEIVSASSHVLEAQQANLF